MTLTEYKDFYGSMFYWASNDSKFAGPTPEPLSPMFSVKEGAIEWYDQIKKELQY